MNIRHQTTRRVFLQEAAGAAILAGFPPAEGSVLPRRVQAKSVTAVVTAYEYGLHADVLLGKILDGWKQDGGPGPSLRLSSMYVDQFSERDMARHQSRKHNIPIFDTIEGALTLGGDRIAVDGVISIGEHGVYPYNAKGAAPLPASSLLRADHGRLRQARTGRARLQ